MRIGNGKAPALAILAGMLATGAAFGQLAHPCGPVAASDFKLTTVVERSTGISEPLKMALDMDAQGNVDIYWVERLGKVKKYTGSGKAVTTIGTIDFYPGYEDGITGIALDPAFKSNRYMYIYYSQGTLANFHFRVSRFTLDAGGVLNMATEKPVIEIAAVASHMHTGGAMRFDEKGDLWITVGENQSGDEGPSNTNDLRGKILRIHPTPDGSYTIPEGNLFKPGTPKTRPEIYVMGCRNPYSIALDPVRKALMWGDIGPDGKGTTEEHNLTTAPGNFGWPYFAGNNVPIEGTSPASKPMNTNARNTGMQELPPAQPAIDSYQQLAAITGPLYRYNGMTKSQVRMPPHFDGLWFVTDFQNGAMDTIQLNKAGTAIAVKGRVFPSMHFDRPVDFQLGPDGAFYVINYAGWFSPATTTGIVRIEYTGSCRPEISSVTGLAPVVRAQAKAPGMTVEITAAEGRHRLSVADVRGRVLATFSGAGAAEYDLAEAVGNRPGIYFAKLTTAAGTSSRTLVLGAR